MTASVVDSVSSRAEGDDRRVLWLVIAGFWALNVTVSAVRHGVAPKMALASSRSDGTMSRLLATNVKT